MEECSVSWIFSADKTCKCQQTSTGALQWVPTSLNMTVSQTSSDTSNHGLLKLIPPSPNPIAEQSYGVPSTANTQIQGHWWTHIDQILLEALTQIFNKRCFAGEVLKQDKILHPHTVAGCQSALHGQPNTVSPRSLQGKAEEGWDICLWSCMQLTESARTVNHNSPWTTYKQERMLE